MLRVAFVLFAAQFVLTSPALADVDIQQLIDDSGIEAGRVPMRDRPGWRPPAKIVLRPIPGIDADYESKLPGVEIVRVTTMNQVREHIATADALIGFCSSDLVDAGERLNWVQIFGAGAERCLAVDAVRNGDVVLTNMQKMSSPVIAEHAIAMTLSLSRGIVQYSKVMPEGGWNRRPDSFEMIALGGRTMLVVGLGGIGTEVARRASALGMTVYGTRNSSRSGPDFVEYVGLADELLELAAKADVIVNALPLTPETTGLFGAAFFDAVKPGAIFINVGRGKTVVTADLVAALEDGRLSAAGLDVTDPEPLPSAHPLWTMENVMITPHVAGAASQRERHLALLRENLTRYVAGDALLNVVDPEQGY
ncbi:MAG: D-2-hydroxyacid dehydrogenase [Woeseiaceae bacterium]|nr:D-2-hydroxyacid dehydrogenase [Woeseiaceae bacterium]